VFPRVFRPGVITEFTRMRDGVEAPAKFSGAHVKRTDVAGRRRQVFTHDAAQDQQIAVDDSRSACGNRDLLRIAAQALAQIDTPRFSKTRYGLAGDGVNRVKKLAGHHEDPPIVALL